MDILYETIHHGHEMHLGDRIVLQKLNLKQNYVHYMYVY